MQVVHNWREISFLIQLLKYTSKTFYNYSISFSLSLYSRNTKTINTTSMGMLSLVVRFLSTWFKLESFGKRKSQLRKHLHKTDLSTSMSNIFLINNWLEVSSTNGVISGQVVLGCIRMKAMEASQETVLLIGFSSCPDFAWWLVPQSL